MRSTRLSRSCRDKPTNRARLESIQYPTDEWDDVSAADQPDQPTEGQSGDHVTRVMSANVDPDERHQESESDRDVADTATGQPQATGDGSGYGGMIARKRGCPDGAVVVPDPMIPGEVLTSLDADLAYSTVMTVLVRLERKGIIVRSRRGRAYAYRSVVAESDVVTAQVRRILRDATDRGTVVHAFLAGLEPADETLLRELLDQADRDRT